VDVLSSTHIIIQPLSNLSFNRNGTMAFNQGISIPNIQVGVMNPTVPIVTPGALEAGMMFFDGGGSGGRGNGDWIRNFERNIAHMSSNERVANVRTQAREVAENAGLVRDNRISRINRRDVYRDPSTGNLFSVDTQHSRFEMTTSKGKHL
jgi:hypothetical protein